MTAKHKVIHTFALFGSFSTLLCCALPTWFVSLGAGAALIGLVSAVPQLIWLSQHKIGLFTFAGVMLIISGVSRYLTRNAPCPLDAREARACKRLRGIGLGVFCFSLLMYAVGFYFAFIAQYLIK
jgi:hypothetical protein